MLQRNLALEKVEGDGMAGKGSPDVSALLRAAAGGDPEAAERLLPAVYADLRRLARARMRNLPCGQTLQPTALVHEAYLRVVGDADPAWNGRRHFFGAAATAMRDILVEEARRKTALKRGGDREREALFEDAIAVEAPSGNILEVDEALKQLERVDARKAKIVELRYFARFTIDETARALGISPATVRYQWRFIRAWLEDRLAGRGADA